MLKYIFDYFNYSARENHEQGNLKNNLTYKNNPSDIAVITNDNDQNYLNYNQTILYTSDQVKSEIRSESISTDFLYNFNNFQNRHKQTQKDSSGNKKECMIFYLIC